MFQYLLTRYPNLGRLYRGEIGLGRSFWLHFYLIGCCAAPVLGVILGIVVGVILVPLDPLVPAAANIGGIPLVDGLRIAFLFCFMAVGYLYLYIAAVGTWRSADAYVHPRSEPFIGTFLAKALIVIFVAGRVSMLTSERAIDLWICLATLECV